MAYPTLLPDFIFPTHVYYPVAAGAPNPATASGGFDGVYQFSNANCFYLMTQQLALNTQTIQIDGQILAKLRALPATDFQAPFANYISGATPLPENLYILLSFTPKDLLFTTTNTTCVLEYTVSAMLASLVLGQPSAPGSIVGSATPGVSGDPVVTLNSGTTPTTTAPDAPPAGSYSGFQIINLPSGATATAYILDYLASATFRIPGTYGVTTNLTNATIDAVSTLDLSQLSFTGVTGASPVILSASDPAGVLAALRQTLSSNRTVFIMPEICPFGITSNAGGIFSIFDASGFPTGEPTTETACSFTVGLVVTATFGLPFDVPDLLTYANADYAVMASGAILNGLVTQRWQTGGFPSSVPTSTTVPADLNGTTVNATLTGTFNFVSVEQATIDYNSNTRHDVIAITGTGQEYPTSLVLPSGQTLLPQGPNDPLFQPGDVQGWTWLGALVPDVSYSSQTGTPFLVTMTNNVTSVLARPFTGSVTAQVFQIEMSAPAQQMLLLAKLVDGLTAQSV